MTKIFLEYIEVPIFKEKVNLVFTKYGPYHAIKKLNLLSNYASAFHQNNIQEASTYLKESNATVLRFNDMTFIILPFNVTHGVIAHEIFHLVKLIMDKRGLTLSDSSEEAYAHLIDWITDEIYKLKQLLIKPK